MKKNESVLCQVCGTEFEIKLVELSRSRPPLMCEDCLIERAVERQEWAKESLEWLLANK